MAYNRYPAVDENNNFPTPVRKALAASPEVAAAVRDGQRDSYTKTQSDDKFAEKSAIPVVPDSYTKAQTDEKFVPRTEYQSGGGGTSTPVDAYTKTESDDKFYTKTVVDDTFAKKSDIPATGGGTGTGTSTPVDAYTKTESDDKFATKAAIPDSYTKTQSDNTFATKTSVPDSYTKTQTDETFAKKTAIPDAYTKTEVDTTFAKKTAIPDSYTKTEADSKFALAGSGGGTAGYTKTETDDKFATKTYVDRFSVTNFGVRTSNVVTSAAGLTPDPSLYSEHVFTALASSLTIANTIAYPTGSSFLLSIKDDGTARPIAFGSGYAGLKDPLPTTTVPGKVMLALFRYAASRARWELFLLVQEA